jgi:hypothetical protein
MAESKTVKVYSPNEGYGGTVGDVRFEKGVAEVAEDSPAMAYFRRRGYGIGEKSPVLPYDKMEPTGPDGKVVDPRDVTEQPFGSRLRDAAVDPAPEDFLAPTNAGKANPHGPKVVAPQVHADGPAGIKPGDVHVDDVAEQEKDEKALATEALIEGIPAEERSTAVVADPDSNMGPLGMSDPGSVEQGVEGAKDVAKANAGSATMPPPANAPASSRRAKGPRSKSK